MDEKSLELVSVTPSEVCVTESLNAAATLKCKEPQENNEVEGGVLTEEMVSGGLSHLGRDPTGQQHVLCSLSLPGRNLRDISMLCHYIHLEKLEISHNNIKDLSCLSHMPHLVVLDVSHNEISNFGIQPLQYLQVANFSHNHIADIKDLAGFLCLRKLDLDYNCLSEISGLEQCSMLTHISLAYNKISKISSLGCLPVTHLCLRGNQLKGVEGLENLQSLQVLDLSMNRITSISGLQNLRFLCSINLEKNQILEIKDLKHILGLPLLTDLNLLENHLQEQPDYRLRVIFLHQHLTMLDQETVSVKEKVSSVNMFDPPMDLLAATDHITHLVYQMGQPQVLYHSTLPTADAPYPMLVLTGPEGCGKEDLVHRLCQEFGDYFGVGVYHTTRKPYVGEENGIDYHFVSEEDFQNLVHMGKPIKKDNSALEKEGTVEMLDIKEKMGKFIQTTQYDGHLFGLTRDAIEEIAEHGLVCCVHMELEGVFSLKKSYFKPRYLLLIPTKVEKFVNHLKSLKRYSPAQIDLAVQRVALYSSTNEQRPRFFDNIIPCDDVEEAYHTLQQVVKDYLLVEEEEEEEERKTTSGSSSDSSPTGHYSAEIPPRPLSESQSATLMSLPGSALDPSGCSLMPCFTNIQADFNHPTTSLELASMRRREQLAREAVVGKRPEVYSQLFKRYNSDVSRTWLSLSVLSSDGGIAEPLDSSILVQTSKKLKDANLGFKTNSILPPIPTGHTTHEAPKSPESPRMDPNPPDEKYKGVNEER